MTERLNGKRVAFLVTDGLRAGGVHRAVRGDPRRGRRGGGDRPEDGRCREWTTSTGRRTSASTTRGRRRAADLYDALVLPGGVVNADHLRMDGPSGGVRARVLRQHKPVSDLPRRVDPRGGRRAARSPLDLVPVARTTSATRAPSGSTRSSSTKGLVSSRRPDDLPAFIEKAIEEISEGEHAGQVGRPSRSADGMPRAWGSPRHPPARGRGDAASSPARARYARTAMRLPQRVLQNRRDAFFERSRKTPVQSSAAQCREPSGLVGADDVDERHRRLDEDALGERRVEGDGVDVPVEVVVAHEPRNGARLGEDRVDLVDHRVAVEVQIARRRSRGGLHLGELARVAVAPAGVAARRRAGPGAAPWSASSSSPDSDAPATVSATADTNPSAATVSSVKII